MENEQENKVVSPAEVQPQISEDQPKKEESALFTSSQFPQHPELRKFLESKLSNPYNKYCIDCKKNTTTHCIVWLGVFVCEQCAQHHLQMFGGNQFSYIKDVYNSHWDDYQLRSVCFGGNQPLFNLMKEYQIDNTAPFSKYRHACVTWYRKRHIALMDDLPFDIQTNPKPPKNFNERLQQTQDMISHTFSSGMSNQSLNDAGTKIRENSIVAGQIISEKASVAGAAISEKTSALKQKLIEKQLGNKIMGMFKKKNAEAAEEKQLNDPEEEKKEEEPEPTKKEES